MGKTAGKLVLIGLDSATLDLVKRFGKGGRLPSTRRRMKDNAGFPAPYGPRIGDVVFFQKAELCRPGPPVVRKPREAFRGPANHRPLLQSPRFDPGSMRAVTIFSGPGIRKRAESTRPINLADSALALTHALGMRTPAQTEGRLLGEIFEQVKEVMRGQSRQVFAATASLLQGKEVE